MRTMPAGAPYGRPWCVSSRRPRRAATQACCPTCTRGSSRCWRTTMAETFDDRLTLLERMADQQLRLNDQLIEVTARLNQEQARHAERLERYDAILTRLD